MVTCALQADREGTRDQREYIRLVTQRPRIRRVDHSRQSWRSQQRVQRPPHIECMAVWHYRIYFSTIFSDFRHTKHVSVCIVKKIEDFRPHLRKKVHSFAILIGVQYHFPRCFDVSRWRPLFSSRCNKN